jgi:hypothetical protein
MNLNVNLVLDLNANPKWPSPPPCTQKTLLLFSSPQLPYNYLRFLMKKWIIIYRVHPWEGMVAFWWRASYYKSWLRNVSSLSIHKYTYIHTYVYTHTHTHTQWIVVLKAFESSLQLNLLLQLIKFIGLLVSHSSTTPSLMTWWVTNQPRLPMT